MKDPEIHRWTAVSMNQFIFKPLSLQYSFNAFAVFPDIWIDHLSDIFFGITYNYTTILLKLIKSYFIF